MNLKLSISPIRFGLCIAFLFLCACSSQSVLIKPNDPIFSNARKRFAHTVRIVDATHAPAAQRDFFLQGEAMYQYRFQELHRGVKPFLAEAAAAVTEFPGFQALAGSFDLYNFRVRAPDAAVQLWESFLAEYPHTKLRDLTLYRLGWAYRSVGVHGFPYKNPNEPFDELIKEAPHSKLAKYAMEAKHVPWRSKDGATDRSIIPGWGEFYAGDEKGGWERLITALVASAAVIYPTYYGIQNGHITWPLGALAFLGLSALSFDYTASFEGSQSAVIRFNENAEDQFDAAHPGAP